LLTQVSCAARAIAIAKLSVTGIDNPGLCI